MFAGGYRAYRAGLPGIYFRQIHRGASQRRHFTINRHPNFHIDRFSPVGAGSDFPARREHTQSPDSRPAYSNVLAFVRAFSHCRIDAVQIEGA